MCIRDRINVSENWKCFTVGRAFFPFVFLVMFHTFYSGVFDVIVEQDLIHYWGLAVLYTSLDFARSCW